MNNISILRGVGLGALVLLAASNGQAATSRAMFCVAVRTVPSYDQDGYVMGGRGPIYRTANFLTDLPLDELQSQWRAFMASHPATYPGNPADGCLPAKARRPAPGGKENDIEYQDVDWRPEGATPAS